ncbi:protein-tyrosine phosphatase [Microbacterium sp. 1154]|uniref:arsenate reductase/protein-tyrosine-phosphatase family protein n=1 Tax=Microbacterium sp. 1154 TaxID=2817733 RepID=UPI00285C7D0E|nr:low molecular weight phosphatase family protein [Microbacterium sp. 1154]MDR6691216.1 protein-tyrosine phosphatase [Microbacterium sp. 1154]
MLTIIAVCTGNICRSPLAAELLASRLTNLEVNISSAGTRARDGMQVTSQTTDIALAHGVLRGDVERHRSRFLTDELLRPAHLALAMAREHRRQIVEMNPSFTRKTFTVRELARLASGMSDDELLRSAASAEDVFDPSARFSAMLNLMASRRGTLPPVAAEDDDVVDPYRRSSRTYELSEAQLLSALPSVERLVLLAFSPTN